MKLSAPILVIAESPEDFSLVFRDLGQNGIEVHVEKGLRSSLAYILEKKPQVVLVPVDHSDRRIAAIPKVLAKNLSLNIIVYANSKSPSTIRLLKSSGVKNIIYPPMSSYLIRRWIDSFANQSESFADWDERTKTVAPELVDIDRALKAVVKKYSDPSSIPSEIRVAEKFRCSRIQSGTLNGYLLGAFGNATKDAVDFFEKLALEVIRNKTQTALSLPEFFDLNINPLDIDKWSANNSILSEHVCWQGQTMRLMFVPSSAAEENLQATEYPKMLEFKLANLEPDQPLLFNLYIQLPLSNKLILLKPQGHPLYGKQKDHLFRKGIHSALLEEDQSHLFLAQKAQSFLNRQVEEQK